MNSASLSVLVLAVSAFLLAFLLTPLVRRIAANHGWVDYPDGKRKKHALAVPRLGGVPILLAYAGSFGILELLGILSISIYILNLSAALKLLPAAAVVFATGLLDDMFGLKPWQKLIGQTLAAALAFVGGIHINVLAYSPVGHLPSLLITIVWLVACSNAFNLIDGLDGLASGLALLATITTLIAGIIHMDIGLVIATAPLAGALLGFLVFNFNPASIFLGDCGSLWLGFMLGCNAIIWSQKTATLFGMTAPLIALCIPLIDTVLSVARRLLRCQPIFSADHAHIHHRLLERGLTPRKVVLLLYAAGGMAACLSLIQSTTRNGSIEGLTVLLFCTVALLGIHYLGYQEFDIAFRVFWHSKLLNIIKFHVSLNQYEKALLKARNAEECGQIILNAVHEFGFNDVTVHLAKSDIHSESVETSEPFWALDVPITGTEWVHLTCPYSHSASDKIGPFVEVLHHVLPVKAEEFNRTESLLNRRSRENALSVITVRQSNESLISRHASRY